MVISFVVHRLPGFSSDPGSELDDPTTYYLLHRNDFSLNEAPAGACVLYALSCSVADAELRGRLDLLRSGREGTFRLKTWNHRRRKGLGEPDTNGRPPPLIDCVHRLMQLWKIGERTRVDAYLEARGLWKHDLFARLLQALIELAAEGSAERAILESVSNHIAAQGGAAAPSQTAMAFGQRPRARR